MTLKEFIIENGRINEAVDPSKMQANGATYDEYTKAVMKKFNAKNKKQLGKDGFAYLDKHWKAKDE